MVEAHKKMSREAYKAELPLSLIETHILVRLPAKSIGRCMCVCKQWRSFLSTPTFVRIHLNNVTINDYKLILFDGQRPVPFRTIPSQPKYPYPGNVFILASLDGLVCLASRESSHLVFWNPLTRAYKKLSPSRDFLFYPNDFIGFYTDSSNDYKLLYLVDGGRFGAYVYSNIMDSWRRIEFSVGSDILRWSCSPATFFGQCLYFIVTAESQRSWIICFDLNTETFRKIKSPPVPDDASDYCGSLVVLNGCIHLCVSYTIIYMDYVDVDLKHGDMWRMDGDRWVKVDAFRDKLYKEFRRQRICTASTGNWLAVSDQETNTFKQTNAEEFTTHYRYFCPPSWEYRSSRMIYVETLVSPNP